MEVNKRFALQQVNFWDTQEKSRALLVKMGRQEKRPGRNLRDGFS